MIGWLRETTNSRQTKILLDPEPFRNAWKATQNKYRTQASVLKATQKIQIHLQASLSIVSGRNKHTRK